MGLRFNYANQDATIFVSDLTQNVTEDILWELFLQMGPVVSVQIPKDKEKDVKNGYAFVEMATEEDARYAVQILNGIPLFSSPMKVTTSNAIKEDEDDYPAKLFVSGLAPSITDMELTSFFSQFGKVISAKVVIDPSSGISNGHAFVTYSKFDESDIAIANANGQYFNGQAISVCYAYKNGTRKGEQHGDSSERLVSNNS